MGIFRKFVAAGGTVAIIGFGLHAAAPELPADAATAYLRQLIRESATDFQKDYRKFLNHREDVARRAIDIAELPLKVQRLTRELKRTRGMDADRRLRVLGDKVEAALELNTAKNLFYADYPAIAQSFVGYESFSLEPQIPVATPELIGESVLQRERDSLLLYLSSLPVACVRADFTNVEGCAELVPEACEEIYASDGRRLWHWEMSEDLQILRRPALITQEEIDRVADRLYAMTPNSRRAARTSAKALVGICGLAARGGQLFGEDRISIPRYRWPEWTHDIPSLREAKIYPEDLCLQFTGPRRENLVQLFRTASFDAETSQRIFDLTSALGACPTRDVAGARHEASSTETAGR